MSNAKQRIQERLDRLQNLMETNYHLENPGLAIETVDSIAKYWNFLSEEDREYLECCEVAIMNRLNWNVNK